MRYLKKLILFIFLFVFIVACQTDGEEPGLKEAVDQENSLLNSMEDLVISESQLSGSILNEDLKRIMEKDLEGSNFTHEEMNTYFREKLTEYHLNSKKASPNNRPDLIEQIWCEVYATNGIRTFVERKIEAPEETFQAFLGAFYQSDDFPPNVFIQSLVTYRENSSVSIVEVYCIKEDNAGPNGRACPVDDTPLANGTAFWNGATQQGECDARLMCYEP